MGRALVAIACAAATAYAEPSKLSSVLIEGVPHVKQEPDFCGEACVEMWGRHLGETFDQDDVFDATGLDPVLGRGAYTPDLVRAVKKLGFTPPSIYTLVDAKHPAVEPELEKLVSDLQRGVPSIVCMHYDDQPHTTEHFRLVIGYDADKDEVVYQEPAEDDGGYRRMSRTRFEKLWLLPSSDDHKRVLVRIPLAGTKLAAPARASGFTPAQYAQHVMALKEQLAARHLDRMRVHIDAPFVVIGDDRGTVGLLKKAFFTGDAPSIVDVYAFPDAASYDKGAKALTGEAPPAPHGFYANGAVILQVAPAARDAISALRFPSS